MKTVPVACILALAHSFAGSAFAVLSSVAVREFPIATSTLSDQNRTQPYHSFIDLTIPRSSGAQAEHSFTPKSTFSSMPASETHAITPSFSPRSSPHLNANATSTQSATAFPVTSTAESVISPPVSLSGSSTRIGVNAATSTASASPADHTTLVDINTIHTRRLPFIIASATQATSISAWLSTIQANGSWPASEIDYTSGCSAQRANWPAEGHWQRLVTMTSAFHGGLKNAGQWANSPELLSAISLAMDFWFSNDFTNVNCLDSGGLAACPCGTPGFWNPNWFSNIIGVPQLIGESCLLMNSSLTSTQLSNCTNIAGRAFATFDRSIVNVGTLTGANTLDVAGVGIDLGLLTTNATLIADAYRRVHNEVVVQQALKADGIRPDGSFGQHAGLIYNGNYGKDYANDVFALEIAAANTQFQANTTSREAFESLIDGDQWMIYRNVETGVLHWDSSVLGRFISFPVADNQATASIKINTTELQVLSEEWGSDTLTDAFSSLSENSTTANIGSLNGNRMFYDSDYMVQRGPGYVSTLRMYSSRTKNTECTNSENPFGFHLSDGTVYTYMTGSEYEDIAAAWDWNLIPGTTVDYNATALSCAKTGFTGVESFVGGASTGNIGVGVMRYTNPLTGSLHWQKAWFFLEGGTQHIMVNDISSATSAPVFSVLDQRKHTTDVYVDGASVANANFTNASTLWHGNVGYTFSNNSGVSLTVDTGLRTGDWSVLGISKQPPPTVDLFAAWLAHTDLDSSVSYTAFPALDYSEFLAQANETQIVDVQNDANVSATLDAGHSTAMIVFWASGGGNVTIPALVSGDAPISVSADKGLLVILDERTWNLTVSDPTQSVTEAEVALQLGCGNIPDGWSGDRSTRVSVTLPTSGSAGSSISISLF